MKSADGKQHMSLMERIKTDPEAMYQMMLTPAGIRKLNEELTPKEQAMLRHLSENGLFDYPPPAGGYGLQ